MKYKYVIMAAGNGTRWSDYLGVPKHLVEINGETILGRTTRLLKENGINDYIITCHDPRYAEYGETVEPLDSDCEIDRFDEGAAPDGPICYIYGDVYFSEEAMKTIVETETDDVVFFGHDWEIFAIKVVNRDHFFHHKYKVKSLFLLDKIDRCIGWEIYRSMNNIDLDTHEITHKYIKIMDGTDDIDYPEEYEDFKRQMEGIKDGNSSNN